MESIQLQDWRFHFGDCPVAWQKGFDDAAWQHVVVPHDWAVEFPFSKDNASGTGYLPGGTGWYRCGFTLSPGDQGKHIEIAFDGAYKNSQVWCNGYYLGKRPSGFAPFTYDISPFICCGEGELNRICVRIAHEDIADARWYTGSGLYRSVVVNVYEETYIPPESIVFTNTHEGEGVTVSVVCEARGASCSTASIRAVLMDDSGNNYILMQQPKDVPSGDTVRVRFFGVVADARRWSPDAPNLYTLLLSLDGKEAARLRVGIRDARFDADAGFFLNGAPIKLKGVCLHDDAGSLGTAVWPEVWRRRLEKLKALGCNAIRMAHNQHMSALYDLCDEMGFLVMDEAFDEWEGPKNKWHQGHNVYPPMHQGYYEDFPAWHEADLPAMVLRGRNRPSIICWSIGNEVDYPNDPYGHPLFTQMAGNNDKDKPAEEMRYNPDKPNMQRLATIAQKLTAVVKRHDNTRPVLVASAFPELSGQLGFFDALDIVGYNYKEHLYNEHHAQRPTLPILGSENGHSLEAWETVRKNKYISGQFLWTGIDYLGESRGEWPTHGSPAGLLTTAGFEKPDYYRRRALWANSPAIWLGQMGEDLVCYTNLSGITLMLDGKPCGKPDEDKAGDGLIWRISPCEGTLEASGVWIDGQRHACLLKVPGQAQGIHLKHWRTEMLESCTEGKYRMHQIEVVLVDGDGVPVISEEAEIDVQAKGPVSLLRVDNGNLSDGTALAKTNKATFYGKAMIYALVASVVEADAVISVGAKGQSGWSAVAECGLGEY